MKANRAVFAVIVVAVIMAVLPSVAMAQATNGVGNLLVNAAYSTKFSYIFSTISYVVGIVLCLWGVLRLKLWSDGGGQISIMEGIWRIAGGALMIALPGLWVNILDTVYGTWGSATSYQYNRIAGLTSNYNTSNGAYLGLDQMMENFVIDVYQPAKVVMDWAGYLVGFGCMINGVYRLALAGQASAGRAPSTKGTVGYIIGGAMMVSFGDLMDAVTTSIFGSAADVQFSSLAYSIPGLNATEVNHVVQSLLAFIELIGWVAFIRGMYLLIKLAQGGAEKTHAHAFTHIVFGALAVNMYQVVKAVQSTLGISIFT